FNLARTLLAVFLMSAIRSSSSCFTSAQTRKAQVIALCFFFTSSTLACILSINTQLTSAKNSSMKLAPSSTVTETSSSPCA
ncbi:unnamed protein product, partial [Ixodes persulcatus]